MTSCTELAPLFVQRELGVLDEEELDRLEDHLDGCAACPALVARLEGALVAAQVPPEPAPAGGWDTLAEALERQEARAPLPIRVHLGCLYCHGRLVPESSIYCAACLAPHHAACFEEHGRCCAPGCGETRVVEQRPRTPLPPAPRRGASWWLVGALVLGAGAGAAALTQALEEQRRTIATTEQVSGSRAPAPGQPQPTYEGKTAAEWIEVLRDHSPPLRARAKQALVALGTAAAEPGLRAAIEGGEFTLAWRASQVLLELDAKARIPLTLYRRALRDTDPEVRIRALRDLEHNPAPAAYPLLATSLGDDHQDVRQAAKEVLLSARRRVEGPALRAVLTTLRDRRPDVRLVAAQVLSESREPTATPALVAALDDDDPQVRSEILSALYRVVRDQLSALGPAKALTDRLVRITRGDADKAARAGAAQLLAHLDASVRLDPKLLQPGLRDPEPRVRLHVAEALGARGFADQEAVARLTELVEDHRLSEAAAKALSRYGAAAKPAIPALIQALESKRLAPRQAGAALAAIGIPFAELNALLTAKDTRRRLTGLVVAARSAHRHLDQAAKLRDAALEGLRSGNQREEATRVLLTLARLERPELEPAIPTLASLVSDRDNPAAASHGDAWLRVLLRAQVGSPLDVIEAVVACLPVEDALPDLLREVSAHPPKLAEALRPHMGASAPRLRFNAAACLLVLGSQDPRVLSEVERVARYGGRVVSRRVAIRVLAGSQHPRRVELIMQRLADRYASVRCEAATALRSLPLHAKQRAALRGQLRREREPYVLGALAETVATWNQQRDQRLLRDVLERVRQPQADPRVLFFDDDWRTNELPVVRALVTLGARDAELLAVLRRGLHQQNGQQRATATVLAAAGDATGLRYLERLLTVSDPEARAAACRALGRLGAAGAGARAALSRCLKDPYPDVRAAAKAALSGEQ